MTETKRRNGFTCKKCGETKESKYRHDFQVCACGNFVDGGQVYYRAGGNLEDMVFMNEPEPSKEPQHE